MRQFALGVDDNLGCLVTVRNRALRNPVGNLKRPLEAIGPGILRSYITAIMSATIRLPNRANFWEHTR